VSLIKADPKIAAEVLPYGGKKIDSPQTAQVPSSPPASANP
jgi:carboxyl-terminal processing protease